MLLRLLLLSSPGHSYGNLSQLVRSTAPGRGKSLSPTLLPSCMSLHYSQLTGNEQSFSLDRYTQKPTVFLSASDQAGAAEGQGLQKASFKACLTFCYGCLFAAWLLQTLWGHLVKASESTLGNGLETWGLNPNYPRYILLMKGWT